MTLAILKSWHTSGESAVVQSNGVAHTVPIGKLHDFPDHILAILNEAGGEIVNAAEAIGLTARQQIQFAMQVLDSADPELREAIFKEERLKRGAAAEAARVAAQAEADLIAEQAKQDEAEAATAELATDQAAKDRAAAEAVAEAEATKEADEKAEAERAAAAANSQPT